MAVPGTKESTLKKPRARDLYDELKPLWFILLIFLAAPIQRGKSGRIISSWLSWTGIFTLGLCAFNAWVAYCIFPVHVQALRDSETFPAGVFASLFILGLNLHVMIPIATWPFAKRLAIYLNDVTDFQDHYAKVSGRQLEFHLYDLSRRLAYVCLLMMPVTVVQFVVLSSAPAWHAYAYFPAAVHSMAVTCAWHCNCKALGSAAEKMADDFATAVTNRGSLTVLLREYRKLWNNLQRLSAALSLCHSATNLQTTLSLMVLNLITSFGVLGAVVAEESVNRIIVMIMMTIITHMELFFLSSAGYKCAEKNPVLHDGGTASAQGSGVYDTMITNPPAFGTPKFLILVRQRSQSWMIQLKQEFSPKDFYLTINSSDCGEGTKAFFPTKVNVKMKMHVLSLLYRRSLVEEHEANLFLKDISTRPASIRIVGYLDIDRHMYVKVIAALARNFLVLLQFAYTGAINSVQPREMSRDDFYDFLR